MNAGKFNKITDYLFRENNVLQAGTESTLPCKLKSKILEVYRRQPSSHDSRRLNDTPIDQRNIEIIDVLPTLARDPDFLKKLTNHAEIFCKNFMVQARSSGIESALKGREPIETLGDAEKFLESILRKQENNQPVTYDEKLVFKRLLTGMLKIDHSLDAKNTSIILNTLLRHSHPDITHQESDLYKCILSKGRRIARVIDDLWYLGPRKSSGPTSGPIYMNIIPTFSDDQLLEAIASLSSLDDTSAAELFNKIRIVLQSRDLPYQEDSFKENLLKLTIESDNFQLLEMLLNQLDFDISQVKIGNETPLIYAIQTADSRGRTAIIRALRNNDTNTLGLEGKTPLQIAIDYYQKFPHNRTFDPGYPYQKAIDSLLNCPNLCVDSEDSTGLTALCYFALFPEINRLSLTFISELINLGANIDHPIPGSGTVRTLLKDKLNRDQFADIENLANNPGTYQR